MSVGAVGSTPIIPMGARARRKVQVRITMGMLTTLEQLLRRYKQRLRPGTGQVVNKTA